MSESALWGAARRHLSRYGWLGRLENSVESGWADVAYTLKVPSRPPAPGWLELKHRAAWPVRPQTPVRLPHLTLDQVLFCEVQAALGARAHVLLQVGRTYLLLEAPAVRRLYAGELTQAGLREAATLVSTNRFPTRELVELLTRPLEK